MIFNFDGMDMSAPPSRICKFYAAARFVHSRPVTVEEAQPVAESGATEVKKEDNNSLEHGIRPIDRIKYRTTMCKFFELGACKRGDACFFAHKEDQLRPSVSLWRTRLCFSFTMRGHCRQGKRCNFAHGKDELLKPMVSEKACDSTMPEPGFVTMAAELPSKDIPVKPLSGTNRRNKIFISPDDQDSSASGIESYTSQGSTEAGLEMPLPNFEGYGQVIGHLSL
ncbi:mRNA decay factor CTH1 [Symbiodinium microadriaticum]|uniref:mRNA decay factor CTH1 n=1 Tax=Symbiodinium microadriaticum TaxID=2951 RepID=A0A1Q9F5I5_SYMMI|nr:mRNA decay factor CTH1 [Symbiodinium microadriaticum]